MTVSIRNATLEINGFKRSHTHYITNWNRWSCSVNVEILGKLPQLKQYATNILPSCKVTEFRSRIDTDNDKGLSSNFAFSVKQFKWIN